MSLSTLNIDTLIEQITDKYINHSNYTTLRNSCTLLSPIPAVTSEIHAELIRLLEIDKQNTSSQLTLNACKEQIQQDLNEKKQDLQVAQNDFKLASQLRIEFSAIQNQMRLNDIEIHNDEANILRLQSLIREIDQNIALASLSHTHSHPNREESTHHHQSTHTHPETMDQLHENTHTHPDTIDQQKQNTHTHPDTIDQQKQNTHTHPETIDQHKQNTHAHPESTHQHGHTESPLELQKKAVSRELDLLRIDLNNKRLTHKKQLLRINEITHVLNLELPEKEKQRNEHALTREARENARLTDDHDLKQLSQKNRLLLQQSIIDAHEKLQKKHSQLMQRVNDTSYQTYLTRLEFLLQSLSHLNYHEKEALIQINRLMQDYLLTKAEEQNVRSTRNLAYLEKEKLAQDLREKERKVDQLRKSNPELTAHNKRLAEENQQLEQTIEERHQYRNNLLKIGLFSLLLTGVAVGGGFLAMKMMPLAITLIPLFFTPAAIVGLITLSLFIATSVYTVINNMDANQLSQNKSTIEENLSTISKQNVEINDLEKKMIPSLNSKIYDFGRNINLLDKRIESLEQQADLLLNNAKKVDVTIASNQVFLGNPPPYSPQFTLQSDIKPSAPFLPEDTVVLGNTFSYN